MTPRPNKVPAVQIPAAIISAMVKHFPSLIATAAMAFMGWNGMGTPKSSPVMIFLTFYLELRG
jgi:hypothetical protein